MTADDSGAASRDRATDDDAVRDVPADDPARARGEGTTGGPDATADSDENNIAVRLEQLILGADRRYTPFQAARAAGVSMDLAARFWRAMGFADIGQVKALTEADVLALRRLAGLVEAGLLSEAMAVQVARSTGQTTARLADWQIDSFLEGLTEPLDSGLTRTEITYPLVELLLPELEEFLVYVWRRQLAAATGRVVRAQDDAEMVDRRLAVGFADLVGFTRLTRRLEEEELGELVEAFETTCSDLVAAHGGRLIKTLGDEVLFSADDAGIAAEIGLRLIETMTHDETMPELRVGIAFGTVTTRMGDVFGTTVNLASRLTSIAPKDTVLVDEAFAEELGRIGDAPVSEAEAAAAEKAAEEGTGAPPPSYRFALQPMWQRPVRGLGVVEPWLLSRRTHQGASG
ncbi:adenylate/guanylate cyclase domain-containing protein [Streptomyces angustmyceticus]|uniref:adenylate/guanylate cyclase domain-containing protein n=1 Tax=Streptomyces angustmyceticus TaxID=285578 RepID=UPI0021AE9BA6|nr:adenylate/guanylate cyclase domain-containing protein [Streptomyces angustmyceticus]